jgi:predicted ATPase
LARAKETHEIWFEAELHRLQGELLRQGAPRKAEFCFQQALDIARGQDAKSWELRAATSLARLYRDQGRHERAHEFLACVYEWFTEGFETPDLQEAKGLLEELTAA